MARRNEESDVAKDDKNVGYDSTIGRRLHAIRKGRRKTLRVVAGLAGISTATLSRIENGKAVLDRLSVIVALADALQVAPSEILALPIPKPGNGHTDSTTEAVRLALDAIDIDKPGGLVLPTEILRDRVTQIHRQNRACQSAKVGAALPGLIRDLHTTLSTGHDHAELLGLGVHLHVHVTYMWLIVVRAPTDLLRRAVFLARRLAQEHDEPTTVGVAAFGVTDLLVWDGAFELATAELDSVTLPATTADTVGLVAALTTTRAMLAVVADRPADAGAAMDDTADLGRRWGELGEADPLGFGFGPTSVGFRQVRLALEAGEPDRAARIGDGLQPKQNPFPASRVFYHVAYGRALARLPKRYDDAAIAFLRAERIHPQYLYRDPLAREAIAELTTRSKHDAIGRELRAMAYRAGLTV
jgi:transcriptional regulator with XRE-family HTH domain